MRFRLVVGILTCIVLLGAGVILPLAAQDEIILSIYVDEWMRTIFNDELFADFYAEHPGVKVIAVARSQNEFYVPAAYDAEGHFEGVERFASAADVLWVSSYDLITEDTRAGFFLDLMPLVTGDPDLNVGDFYPSIWQSFQWDGGIWGMPVGGTVSFIMYNPAAFDEAGLSYPNEGWTFDDYANATRALAQVGSDGKVEAPGFIAWDAASLYVALTGERYYDDSTFPASPRIYTPELEAFLETYVSLQEEGVLNPSSTGSLDINEIPMMLDGPWRLYNAGFSDEEPVDWQVLLPGGRATLSVQGFAVSAGTDHPELAYELTKYLTTQPQIIGYTGSVPARQSMVGVQDENNPFARLQAPAEVQAVIDRALANAIPTSEIRFGNYVSAALSAMLNEDEAKTAQQALQDAEAEAIQNLETAEAIRNSVTLMVAQPTPTPVLAQGEISLRFRLSGSFATPPNRDQWDALIREFVATDPEVGNIELITGFSQGQEEVDCFYEDWDGRVANMDMANPDILSLDPLVGADPAFNRDDLIPRVLDQVTRDNQIWGYPIAIFPEVLWYNHETFTEANAIAPVNGWDVAAFNDALEAIGTIPDGLPAFVPNFGGATYLSLLMAAYGAIPYDDRTNPPTLNFNDPATIEGMRQVLDLAKAGYIDYQELADMGGGFFSSGNTAPIMTDSLSAGNWRLLNRGEPQMADDPYLLTTYPIGSQYTPLSYSVGSAFIADTAVNPEACYRWISTLAQHPNLLIGMPARRSQLSDPTLAAALGDNVIALYEQYSTYLDDPNAIVFARYGSSSYRGAWMEQRWLYRVFDRYVLENGDLEADLVQLEADIAMYRECLANVPEYSTLGADATEEEWMALQRQIAECAIAIDPSARQYYSYLYDGA